MCVAAFKRLHRHILQVAEAAERLQWALKHAVWDQSAADEVKTKLAAEHLLHWLQQRYASCSWHGCVAAFFCRLQPRLTAAPACSSTQAAAEVCQGLYSPPDCRAHCFQSCLVGCSGLVL